MMGTIASSQVRRTGRKLAGGASHRLEPNKCSALEGRRIIAGPVSIAPLGCPVLRWPFRWLAPPANLLTHLRRGYWFAHSS